MDKDNTDTNSGGAKFDAGKVRMDLVPMDAIMAVAAVFTYGAKKYADWNWSKGMRRGRLDAALLRHAAARALGEELDDESGLPHSWHIGCCALMQIAGELRDVLEDDRDCKHNGDYTTVDGGTNEFDITDSEAALVAIRRLFRDMKDPVEAADAKTSVTVPINEQAYGRIVRRTTLPDAADRLSKYDLTIMLEANDEARAKGSPIPYVSVEHLREPSTEDAMLADMLASSPGPSK